MEDYFSKATADPWSVPTAAKQEMDMATRGAAGLAETLRTRKLMAADHPADGGYFRAPIVAFPFGPREVLAFSCACSCRQEDA